jgi:hypothetical protein
MAFREKFIEGLEHLSRKGQLDCGGPASAFQDRQLFAATMQRLKKERRVVDARPPFGGPQHVLRYLGRYTHRIAISNHRLLGFDGQHAVLNLTIRNRLLNFPWRRDRSRTWTDATAFIGQPQSWVEIMGGDSSRQIAKPLICNNLPPQCSIWIQVFSGR